MKKKPRKKVPRRVLPPKPTKAAAKGSRHLEKKLKKLQNHLARLEEERRVDGLRLAVFKEIGRIADGKTDFDRLLDRTMDLVLKAMGTESGTLYFVDELTRELVFRVVKGSAPAVAKLQGQRLKWGEGIAGHVVQSGKPYLTLQAARDKRYQKRVSESVNYEIHDILCVPLHSPRGKILGAIQVINRKTAAAYTRDDLDTLMSFANQIATVLENAQFFFKLSQRNKELNDLHSFSQLLTSQLDRIEVRKAAIEAVVEVMNCETGSLFQIDKERGEVYFDVALGEKGDVAKAVRLRLGEGVAGWVAKAGKPVLIPDCSVDARFTKRVDQITKFTTRNMICAPLLFNQEVIGVLQALNRKSGTFSQEDLQLFMDLANQVAIALKNAMLFEDLRRSFYESVTALAEAIELRDPYTGGHTQRVRRYSLAIAKQLGFTPERLEIVSLSSILHDIGKIGVADQILRKQGKLDYEEFLEMKKHPEYGYKILKGVGTLAMSYDGVLYHHERWDGKGYPKGLKAENIPLVARIIAVADTFDAMTTNRPYRDGLTLDFVLNEIKQCAGSQFDPKVVKAFLKAYEAQEIILG